jgi:hypothetical protein
VSEADVQLASTLGAAIVGFNVPMPSRVTAAAEKAGVPFHTHKVIYELVDGGHFDIVARRGACMGYAGTHPEMAASLYGRSTA